MKQEEKDRNKILSGVLNEDFKTSRQRFLSQGFEPEIVDSYILKFKTIKDKNYKQINDDISNLAIPPNQRKNIDTFKDFDDLELFVDYVGGQVDVSISNTNFEDIQIDGKPIYNKDGIEIYYADTPRACIKYKGNVPYSWCIARTDASNMFYTYRFKDYEPSFYFVKNIERTKKEFGLLNVIKDVFKGEFKDKYHFFVVQVPKNVDLSDFDRKQFVVTSAQNDGDEQMSWKELLKVEPKLKNAASVFEPKPLGDDEKEKVNKYKRGISDEEFKKLDYKQKSEYLDIYVSMDRHLTDYQFLNLPEDLKNKYLSFGVGLTKKQFENIKSNNKLVKRYIEITKRKYEEFQKGTRGIIFTDNEFDIISDFIPENETSKFFQDLRDGNVSLDEIMINHGGSVEMKSEDGRDICFEMDKSEFIEKFGDDVSWTFSVLKDGNFNIDIDSDYIHYHFKDENEKKMRDLMAAYGYELKDSEGFNEGEISTFLEDNDMEDFLNKIVSEVEQESSIKSAELAKEYIKNHPFNYDKYDSCVTIGRDDILNFMILRGELKINNFDEFLNSYANYIRDIYSQNIYFDIQNEGEQEFDDTYLNINVIEPFLDNKLEGDAIQRVLKIKKIINDLKVDEYNKREDSRYNIEILNMNPNKTTDDIEDPTIEVKLVDKQNDNKEYQGNVKLSSLPNYIHNYQLFEIKKIIKDLVNRII